LAACVKRADIAIRIINAATGVNCVVYDVMNKPPEANEWE
jgi:GMP synthase PP-ATPase subunit